MKSPGFVLPLCFLEWYTSQTLGVNLVLAVLPPLLALNF